MDLREYFTTTNLLNRNNPQLHSKYLFLHPQTSVVLHLIKESSLWNIQRSSQKTTTNINGEFWNPIPIYIYLENNLSHLSLRKYRRVNEKSITAWRSRSLLWGYISPSDIGRHTHIASPTWLPKPKLKPDDRYSKLGPQPHISIIASKGMLRVEEVLMFFLSFLFCFY